jgi:predicted glycosyltransferase
MNEKMKTSNLAFQKTSAKPFGNLLAGNRRHAGMVPGTKHFYAQRQMSPMGSPEELVGVDAWTSSQDFERASSKPSDTHVQPRIALYSHDTMGLGHMRRNLLIAQTLSRTPLDATVLIIAGARRAASFALPPSVDTLCLPALHKGSDGLYSSRRLNMSLQNLVALRASTIRVALEAFEPDVLIVDNVPRGAQRELDPTLEFLREQGRTHCVLGLRDVLDDPAVTRGEWREAQNEEAIRKYYDSVWVYGDPAVYDTVKEYEFAPDIATKSHYTGYFDQRTRLDVAATQDTEGASALELPPGRIMLCTLGGGQDGAKLAEAFAQAELPADAVGVVLTGPSMPEAVQRRLQMRTAVNPRLKVLEFFPEPAPLLQRAERVIAMGGYNTVNELLSFEKPALIVPRAGPRYEQVIRAERLQQIGLIDMLHADQATPGALSTWMARNLKPPQRVSDRINLTGLRKLPHLLENIFATAADSEPTPRMYLGA